MSDYNLEQPHALPHVPTETVYLCPTPSELAPVSLLGCAVCGGRMTEARGRHPGDAPRIVCPTCLADKMDMIRELADRDYGRACSALPNAKLCRPADSEAGAQGKESNEN